MRKWMLLLAFTLPLFAQTPPVRQLVVEQDYDAAIRAFAAIQEPTDEERAFAVAAYALSGRTGAAKRELAVLESRAPGKTWTLFAAANVANAAHDSAAALEAGRRMMAAAGADADEEIVRLHVFIHAAVEKHDEALALLAKFPQTPRLRATRAQIHMQRGEDDEADALLEALRKESPELLQGWVIGARQALGRRRPAEALPLLRQAVKLSASPRIHAEYWRALSSAEMTAEEKRAELERDMAELRARRGEIPEVWLAIASEHARLGNEAEAAEWSERVIREAPNTVYAARAVWSRYTSFMKKNRTASWREDAALRAERKKLIRDYLDYKIDDEDFYRRSAYSALYQVLKLEPEANEAELIEAVQDMTAEIEGNPGIAAEAATLLATRGIRIDLAEQIARRGYDALPAFAASVPESQADLLSNLRGAIHGALGWVLLKQGKVEAARTQLLAAYELYPNSPATLFHLGQWYESQKAYDKAEKHYRRGAALQMPEENPNEGALRVLYRKRYGTLAGYETYRKNAEKADIVARRSSILAGRRRNAPRAPDFRLKTLDGRDVSLASLAGKTAVVNFWGIWCGWCVREMPEYQQLAKKYANDPSVAILTINNDGDAASVRKWMAAQKYDFSVLLDDGFVRKNSIQAFPTTWFLDAKGRIAFEKKGWTQKLLEEFSWRVEELKAGR